MRNTPAYPITSVDNALLLSRQLILQESLSVSEAAESVGVARSTAHRLLAMLIHHGFAEQTEDRRYRAGPILRSGTTGATSIDVLRQAALPTMEALVVKVGETVTLQVLSGTKVRVIDTVECDRSLRIGSRTNRVLDAHQTSGGKVLIALLSDEEILRRFGSVSGLVMSRLMTEIGRARELGYATNDQESEIGVSAIGTVIPNRSADATAAVTIAIPTVRVSKKGIASLLKPLQQAAEEIASRLPSTPRTGAKVTAKSSSPKATAKTRAR